MIEVHNKKEINDALKLNSDIIGINNRNLDNLKVDLKNVNNLTNLIPDKYTIIAESGIKTKEDINEYNTLLHYFFANLQIPKNLVFVEFSIVLINKPEKNEILINLPILTSWTVHLKYLNEVF